MFRDLLDIKKLALPGFLAALIIAGGVSLWHGPSAKDVSARADNGYFESANQSLNFPDAVLYRTVFALQDDGKMAEANVFAGKIGDRSLMGHVLYQRYMHSSYKTNFAELKDWMDLYADHPEAAKIYTLAQRRKPDGFKGNLRKPETAAVIKAVSSVPVQKIYTSSKKRNETQKAKFQKFQKEVSALAADYKVDQAIKMLEKKSGSGFLDQVEYDALQARIAEAAFYSRQYDRAYGLSRMSYKHSAKDVPLAGWVAGLSAWRKGQYRQASQYFEAAATSPYASESMAAGAYYWSARAKKEIGDRRYYDFMEKSASYPRTFYGLIATASLGQGFDFNWSVPSFNKKYHDILADIPAGQRAMALAAIGQAALAESELLRIDSNDVEIRDALMAFAADRGMPVLAMRLGGGKQGAVSDAAAYPKTAMMPTGGYTIDPALIHAIAHQESKFNPNATSSKGATGLMQLMPSTASAMAGNNKYSLKDPKSNLELGQLYIQHLLTNKNVKGDLVSLLMAYNAGPGNLARWKAGQAENQDPVFLVETIPYGETRGYVKRVLTNYWMYSLRDQSEVASLNAFAKGKPALYAVPEDSDYAMASSL